MTIKEFIETAIDGGWKPFFLEGQAVIKIGDNYMPAMFQSVALDPKAWKAVAKVKGWKGKIVTNPEIFMNHLAYFPGQYQQIGMIEALWSGQTLEEYIATL